jgi:hypothetical protein
MSVRSIDIEFPRAKVARKKIPLIINKFLITGGSRLKPVGRN